MEEEEAQEGRSKMKQAQPSRAGRMQGAPRRQVPGEASTAVEWGGFIGRAMGNNKLQTTSGQAVLVSRLVQVILLLLLPVLLLRLLLLLD